MRRRDFIKGIAGSAAGWPIALHAQSAGAMQRVGWLDLFREDDPFVQGRAEAVREDLATAGGSSVEILRSTIAGASPRLNWRSSWAESF
jgi:hypothetical protein